MLQRLKYKMVFYTYSGGMLCGSMLERVLISCIEVVNVTNIEMQDVFFIPTAGVLSARDTGERVKSLIFYL